MRLCRAKKHSARRQPRLVNAAGSNRQLERDFALPSCKPARSPQELPELFGDDLQLRDPHEAFESVVPRLMTRAHRDLGIRRRAQRHHRLQRADSGIDQLFDDAQRRHDHNVIEALTAPSDPLEVVEWFPIDHKLSCPEQPLQLRHLPLKRLVTRHPEDARFALTQWSHLQIVKKGGPSA